MGLRLLCALGDPRVERESDYVPFGNHDLTGRLIPGTLHDALDAYWDRIERFGDRLETGELKPYQRLRLQKVDRLKRKHKDIQLRLTTYDRCAEMIDIWRNRPETQRGTRSAKDHARRRPLPGRRRSAVGAA
jgi:hypothetical protein